MLLNKPIDNLTQEKRKMAGTLRTKFVQQMFNMRRDEQRYSYRVEKESLANEKERLNEIDDLMGESQKLAAK
jgi:hypothetical protein